MRYHLRTHWVSVAWLHERFSGKDFKLVYEESAKMCADIYTKAFTDAQKWQAVCWLINIVDPAEIVHMLKQSEEGSADPPPGGGVPNDGEPARSGGPGYQTKQGSQGPKPTASLPLADARC